MYGPVVGSGVVPASLPGAEAGSTVPKGTASWSSHSASGAVRFMVMVLVVGLPITPPARVQVAGVFRHADAPTSTAYQEPALGLETLKSRCIEATTSWTVTG